MTAHWACIVNVDKDVCRLDVAVHNTAVSKVRQRLAKPAQAWQAERYADSAATRAPSLRFNELREVTVAGKGQMKVRAQAGRLVEDGFQLDDVGVGVQPA